MSRIRTRSILSDAIVTFEKDLAPGVRVFIDGVPAKVRSGPNPGRLYDRKTAARLEELLSVAREMMREGEKKIQLQFDDDERRITTPPGLEKPNALG